MNTLKSNPYAFVRGFNYWPSYAMVLDDVMDRFDPGTIRRELRGAAGLGANCVRIWVSNVSWQRNPAQFLADFEAILSAADECGIRVMPTLFNRWVDTDYPVGQLDLTTVLMPLSKSNREYLQSFVGAFRGDRRILMWDLCNEPFYPTPLDPGSISNIKAREMAYWMDCVRQVRQVFPEQPVTIGFCGPCDPALDPLYRQLDVISFHPYADYWNSGFAAFTDAYVGLCNHLEKPLLCTETCQGSLDDQVRGEIIRQTLDVLKDRDIGWLAWQLCEGKVVTSNRERTDGNCRPGESGYMPFLLADGSIRPYHGIVLEYTRPKGTAHS